MMNVVIKMLIQILALISLIGESHQIILGNSAADGQFPWTVAMYSGDEFICTASLIGERTVLTAAKCVSSDGDTQNASAFYGIANVKRSSSTVRIEFRSIVVHPEFDSQILYNDIAILKTKEPVQFSDTVKPICTANDTIGDLLKERVVAMGWGNFISHPRAGSFYPDNLQFLKETVISSLDCGYHMSSANEPKILCAETLSSGGVCDSDKGGPLVYYNAGVPIQVGIASYSSYVDPCGARPTVFTPVSSYTAFIKDNTSPGELC